VGGTAFPCDLSARDYEICETLAPFLIELGMYLVGLDVIGSYLTEVNVTSPTGFCSLEELYGIKAAEIFWEGLGI
jgi:glutathione synthase